MTAGIPQYTPFGRSKVASRVRKRLYLVIEQGYWILKQDQLLGRLAALGRKSR
jgi:hypothetical protein